MVNNKAGWVLGGFVFIVGISVEVAFEKLVVLRFLSSCCLVQV